MAFSGRQVLLPLWHGVSKDEVVSYSPSLADRVALRTADSTIEEIADEIAAVSCFLSDPYAQASNGLVAHVVVAREWHDKRLANDR